MVTFVATGTVIEIFEPGSFAPEMYLKQKDECRWGKNYGILFLVFPTREVQFKFEVDCHQRLRVPIKLKITVEIDKINRM